MKPKINLNRPPVSSEEVLAGKNFNRLMGDFKLLHKPFYKSTWFVSTAVATVATVAIIATVALNDSTPGTENTSSLAAETDTVKKSEPVVKYDEDSPCINPPVKGAEKPYSSYVVDASKGGQFTHTTGTLVNIPARSLVDENGNRVSGKVEIRYREFHDAVDIFLSGIPMTYDSAGAQSHFQSAGMMEMLCFQQGKPVQLEKGKTIEVKLASLHSGNEFNVYALDTASKNWVYKGKDVVSVPVKNEKLLTKDTSELIALHKKKDIELKSITTEIQKKDREIKQLVAEKPQAPKKVDVNKYNFDIDVDKNEFPELALFRGIRFEAGGGNNAFTSDYYDITWDDAKLQNNKKGESYLLTLTKGETKKTVVVFPVYDEKNYPAAKEKFDKKMREYEEKLQQKEKEKTELTASEKATRQRWEKEIETNRSKMLADLNEERKSLYDKPKSGNDYYASLETNLGDYAANSVSFSIVNANDAVQRTFRADGFGVWNCDNPKQLPKGEKVMASFSNKFTGLQIHPQFTYLMEQNTNTVYTYSEDNYKNFRFDPGHTNFIIASLSDGRLAVFSTHSFSELPKRMRTCDFKLHVFNEIPRTEKKVREMLGSV